MYTFSECLNKPVTLLKNPGGGSEGAGECWETGRCEYDSEMGEELSSWSASSSQMGEGMDKRSVRCIISAGIS